MLRRTATAALLGAMALAAVIVSQQSVGYRRRGSTDEVALAQEDAFSQELAMLSTKLTPQQVRAQRAKAEQLLAKARGEMKQRGPEITALLKHSQELDARLAAQQAAEKKMQAKVNYAQSEVDRLMKARAVGLQEQDSAGDSGAADASQAQEAGKAIAQAYKTQHPDSGTPASAPLAADDDGGPMSAEDMDNGVDAAAVRAAAAAIAKAYAGKQGFGIEDGSADDWLGQIGDGMQRRTSRHGEGADDDWANWQRHEEEMGYHLPNSIVVVGDGPSRVTNVDGDEPLDWGNVGMPRGQVWSRNLPTVRAPWVGDRRARATYGAGIEDGSPLDWASASFDDTPDVERVKKLMQIQQTKKALKQQEADLEEQVYADAQNGKLSHQQASPLAQVFSEGFIQGAVEASKKSVEQQGKFEHELETQGELVQRLEGIVRELEEAKRKENFDKTAAAVAQPAPAPAPAPAPPAPPPAPPAPAPAPAAYVAPKVPKDFKKIPIDFYMEAECPGCKAFTTGILTDTLNAVGDWVTLNAIPYGNANLNNSIIACQHGPDECIGNKIELCMMKQYGKGGDWKAWYPAFKCIEASYDSPENASKTCLPDSGMDRQAILDCAKGNEGDLLHMAAAQMTIDLDPPHKWTPWVLLDGKPLEDKTEQLLAEICKKIPKDAQLAIPQCSPKFKAMAGGSALAGRRDTIQKCYPTDPLSQLILGQH